MRDTGDLARRDLENTHCRNMVRTGREELGFYWRACGQPVSVIGALYCEACDGPSANNEPQQLANDSLSEAKSEASTTGMLPLPAAAPSDPREASRGPHLSNPCTHSSPGGRHPKTHLILGAIETQVEELVWVLAGNDYRASADMLEEIACHLQEASEQDRRKARLKAREPAK